MITIVLHVGECLKGNNAKPEIKEKKTEYNKK